MKKITQIILGTAIGAVGISLTAIGMALNIPLINRGGIVLVTIGVWVITWSK